MVHHHHHHRHHRSFRRTTISSPQDKQNKPIFNMNDHIDILIEILTKLDDRSLGAASCVCRLWCTIARTDSLWENLCFRHLSPPPTAVRPVVLALGGYKKLYMVCVRPVLSRLGGFHGGDSDRVWTRNELQLSLSLFCIEYYERLGDASTSSLMFLCKPVNGRLI